MVSISLDGITKLFDEVVAVDHVTLQVPHGELFTILGPSGCGKSTLLRVVAGFEFPDEGRVLFDGTDITTRPPYKRNTGMVFQNYALWNHMTVYDNVAYGLKVRKVSKRETRESVKAVLELVGLEGLENRTPLQLSGGQQQRVALARALVIHPQVLLLDEPLSNLDAKLRLEVRAELRKLIERLRLTALYVTHDQEEAMSISDHVAVMNKGALQQVGTPRDIYMHPETPFVADFIGQSTFFDGKVLEVKDRVLVDTELGFPLKGIPSTRAILLNPGEKVVVSIRPENFTLSRPSTDCNAIRCRVEYLAYLGSTQRVYASAGAKRIIAEVRADHTLAEGSDIELFADPEETTIIRM